MNTEDRHAAARVLQAMAHPLRLGILENLQAGEMPLKQLHAQLPECSQPMFSQQIRILEQQGLVTTRKIGTAKFCSLGNPDFNKLFVCLESHLSRVQLAGRSR